MSMLIAIEDLRKDYLIEPSVYNKVKYLFGFETNTAKKKNALRNVSFSIRSGESVGIIGRNGSGKSTLLQIICKTLKPTKGRCDVKGRISALLELGSGFSPDYTGYENVIINGLLLGLTKEEILLKMQDIHEYSGIGEAIYSPVKTYSTGMVVRLAFSVLIHCEPDILVIDEALSVGDFFFQQKCLTSVRDLKKKGVTLLFVSHDMGAVRDICDRGIYLKNGEVAYDGPIEKASWHYFSESYLKEKENNLSQEIMLSKKEGLNPGIKSIKILNRNLEETDYILMGDYLIFQVDFIPPEGARSDITLTIKNRFGVHCTTMNTLDLERDDFSEAEKQLNRATFKVKMLVEAGEYSIDIDLGLTVASNFGCSIDAKEKIGPIRVIWDYEKNTAPFAGMFGLPVEKQLKKISTKHADTKESIT